MIFTPLLTAKRNGNPRPAESRRTRFTRIFRSTAFPYVALGLLSAAVYLPRLGTHDLWNPDEPRYAEVTREMDLADEYLVPHLNGEIYAQKPPLMFWAIHFSTRLTGSPGATATRLPSALAAIGTVLLAFALGRRLFSVRAGWIAALVTATNVKVLWQGRVGQIDMLLTFLVTLAVWSWSRGRFAARPIRDGPEAPGHSDVPRDPSRGDARWIPLFFLIAGLATLAKGPVGLLPPLLSIVVFLLWERDRAGLRRLGLVPGLVLWALVVLAWLAPAAVRAGEPYLQEIAFRQTVTRYVDPWHHHHSWYYYLTVIPVEFFPWSFVLPAAVVAGWRGLSGPEAAGFRFAAVWAVVTVVFFSLSSAKRDVYILTMYPALALITGAGLDRLAAAWPDGKRWVTWSLAPLAIVCFAATLALPVVAREYADPVALLGLGFVVEAMAVTGLLGLGAAAALGLAWSDRPAVGWITLAAATLVAGAIASVHLIPRLDPINSLRQVGETVVREVPPGEPYAIWPRIEPSVLFYSRRFAVVPEDEAALRAFVARPGHQYVLVKASSLGDLDLTPRDALEPINPDGSRPYVLWRAR